MAVWLLLKALLQPTDNALTSRRNENFRNMTTIVLLKIQILYYGAINFVNTESHKTNRGRPLAAPYLEDYELNKKLVNHQLTATNTVVELHLHYINTCRHVQFIYVVDTIHVELTYNAAVQINQSSTSQHAVFPVVVDDQLSLIHI